MIRSNHDVELVLARLTARGQADGGPVLRFGAIGQWLVDALAEREVPSVTITGDWASIQLDHRAGVVLVDPVGDLAAARVHCAIQHATPGAFVVFVADATEPDDSEMAARFDLQLVEVVHVGDERCAVHRRTERFTIHDLVFEARASITRIDAASLAAALADPSPPLVLDTRTHTDRQRFGVIEGSIHAPRTVLEWHLDPANGYQHPAVGAPDDRIVIVCNGGYSSSLAAANLARLGFTDVADLIGGMRAWIAAGLPTGMPDHSHLDL